MYFSVSPGNKQQQVDMPPVKRLARKEHPESNAACCTRPVRAKPSLREGFADIKEKM
jgi:hypothetical protein